MLKYGITAEDLHNKIIESLRKTGEHMSWNFSSILEGHETRPLEQTIDMCLFRVCFKESGF